MAVLRVRIREAAWRSFGSVAKFAEAAGVAQATAYAYLNGRNVTTETLERLASAAGVVMLSTPAGAPPAGRSDKSDVSDKSDEKTAEKRRWRLLAVTRCSRPQYLPEVCRSVRAAAKSAFCNIFHAVMLDTRKVTRDDLPKVAEAGVDAAAWYTPAPGDNYLIGAINAAIKQYAQAGDWVIVLDDDTTMTATAACIVKKCHEAEADLLVWGADVPDELAQLRAPRDLAGNCVGRIDLCNYAFKYEAWARCPFQVAAGGFADGAFVSDALRLGSKALYFAEQAGRYNALTGGKRG